MHVDDLFLLIAMRNACVLTQLSVYGIVNVARSLGCARSAFCNKTQSKQIDDLFLLISERSDAQL